MQPGLGERRALVLGGTGAVGSAVLRELARRGVATTFTYCRSEERAKALATDYGHRPVRIDFTDVPALSRELQELGQNQPPNVLIHCAGVSQPLTLEELRFDLWQQALAVNAQSALLACQWFAGLKPPEGDIVLVGALDRTQSLPLPAHFAATQGMLSALVTSLGHELGPRSIRVNQVALGMLNTGLSTTLLDRRRKDYEQFSALRRVGTPEEAARTIVWLALENRYIQGKVVSVNGGI